MGIHLYNKNRSFHLTYYGFYRVKEICLQCIDEDLQNLYATDSSAYELNSRLSILYDNHTICDKDAEIFDHFICGDESEDKLSYSGCKQLFKFIKDCNYSMRCGYTADIDCPTFEDFKNLVRDCAENRLVMKWNG